MTRLFRDKLRESRVQDLWHRRREIQLDPPYQRAGDIWSRYRQRLLIDSIVNNYDVPKIYLRHFVPSKEIDGTRYDYAVIDGRQRLEAIWAYLDNKFTLDPVNFDYVDDPTLSKELASLLFSELSLEHPHVAKRVVDYLLDVITVETHDEDLIEDMFLRLNEAAALNAAEKRNAFGGPVPELYRTLCAHPFFFERLPYGNTRYRHFDIATKFLYFEFRDGVADTKRVYLDRFVRESRHWTPDAGPRLLSACQRVLDVVASLFDDKDALLKTVGMASVYYLVTRQAISGGWESDLTRDKLEAFDEARAENRLLARQDESDADYDLVEFERYAQSPNDQVALRFRRDVLLEFLGHPVVDEPLTEEAGGRGVSSAVPPLSVAPERMRPSPTTESET